METVQELKNKIALLERQENEGAWKEWFDKGKCFLEGLVGRCFMHNSTDSAQIFKVLRIKVQGVWTAKTQGYFELETEGYFTVNSAKYNFTNRFVIPPKDGPYGTFTLCNPKFTIRNKKVLSQLNYMGQSLHDNCSVDTSRVAKLGRYGLKNGVEDYGTYAVCQPKPVKSVREEFFGLLVYEIPVEMYDDALLIANEIAQKTNEYWKKYENAMKGAKRLE